MLDCNRLFWSQPHTGQRSHPSALSTTNGKRSSKAQVINMTCFMCHLIIILHLILFGTITTTTTIITTTNNNYNRSLVSTIDNLVTVIPI